MLRLQRLDRSHISRRRTSTQSPSSRDVKNSVISTKEWVRNRFVREPRFSFATTVVAIAFISVICILIFWFHHFLVRHVSIPSKVIDPIPSSIASDVERQRIRQQIQESIHETQLESYSSLPRWMKEYMQWHQKQMQSYLQEVSHPTQRNTFFRDHPQYKFLIARCIWPVDTACGGLSDRLKTLPTLLLLAHESKRILLFHWSKPMRLEEFLLPNRYMNWSIPMIPQVSSSKKEDEFLSVVPLIPVQGLGTRMYTKLSTLVKALQKNSTIPILCTRLQDQHGGSEYYNSHPLIVRETTTSSRPFRRVFRALFFTLFQPSSLVWDHLARDTLALERQLPSSRYSRAQSAVTLWSTSSIPYEVAHLRAFYGNHEVSQSQINARAMNAVDCAKMHSPTNNTTPILFLSDSSLAINHVSEQQARRKPDEASVVMTLSRNAASETVEGGGGDGKDDIILHLDKSSPGDKRSPTAYASIFTDLFFMSNARCIAYGQGGYGRMGALLQRDPFCFYNYFQNAQFKTCTLSDEFRYLPVSAAGVIRVS